jgi:hypothetical protein|tara:strand:+ start:835 stop:1122 length:288 start_codon:yes stop_codon:yes gene_type:complete
MKLYDYFDFDESCPDFKEYSKKLDDYSSLEAMFYSLTKFWSGYEDVSSVIYDEVKKCFVITMTMKLFKELEREFGSMPSIYNEIPMKFKITKKKK